MQREMAQPILALGDRGRGAAHMPYDKAGEHGQPRQSQSQERNRAADDLGAGLRQRPGETADRLPAAVEQIHRVVPGGRPAFDLPQMGKLEPDADLLQESFIDHFDGDDQRCGAVRHGRGIVVGHDRNGRDDGGLAHEFLQPRGARRPLHARRGIGRCLLEFDRFSRAASAHRVDDRRQVPQCVAEQPGIDALATEESIDEAIRRIDDEDIVMLEIGLEPQSDPGMDPGPVETRRQTRCGIRCPRRPRFRVRG